MSTYVANGPVQMIGYEDLTISTTAVGFTEAKYNKSNGSANTVWIRVSADVRMTLNSDNTDLTLSSSSGITIKSTDPLFELVMDDLSKVKFIRVGGTDVTANIMYLAK